MHCKWVVVTVLDRRRKRLRLLYRKRNRKSAECRDTCQVRKNRDAVGRRQRQESARGTHRRVWIYPSRAAGKQDNLHCSVSSGCENTITKQERVNRKRFQSSRQEPKASKEKAMTLDRKKKRTRGWK